MMDSGIKYLCVVLTAFSFAGCVKEEFGASGDKVINLDARVGSPVLVKSTNAGIDYDSPDKLDLTLIRWDESEGNNSPSGREEISATMGAPSQDGLWLRKIDFASGHTQFYASRTSDVGFAGWYPDASSKQWVKDSKTGKSIHSDGTMVYNIDGKTDVMFSTFSRGSMTTGMPPLKFRHALCLFKIYAYAVDEPTRLEWGELNQVTVMNFPDQLVVNLPSDITSGDATFSYRDGGANGNYVMMPEGASKPLHVGVPTAGPECFVGSVMAGCPVKGLMGINVRTAKQDESGNSISIVRDFKPGCAYNIFLRLSSKGIINAEVSVGEWQYEENDYIVDSNFKLLSNLSRYGTANSYIISSGNRGYCFDATIKGNGVNTLSPIKGKSQIVLPDKNIKIEGIDSVKIIRSDAMMELVDGKWQMITDPAKRKSLPLLRLLSNKLSNGKVLFKTVGDPNDLSNSVLHRKGNVKIGVFDKAGNILWSWHIWVTDKPRNQGYANGYVSLDRNLGAVSVDYANYKRGYSHWSGLYYQFGRKDPIYRATVDERFNAQWKTDVVTMPVPVSEAHRHPVTYFYDKDNAAGTNYNWTTDEGSEYFWGFTSVRDDIVKTCYDPCPPGYRIPGTGIFEQSTSIINIEAASNNLGEPAGFKFNIGGFVDIYYPHTICIAEGKVQECDMKHIHAPNENNIYLGVATPYDPTLYDKPGEVEGGVVNPQYKNLSWHFRYTGEPLVNNANTVVSDPEKYYSERSSAFPVRCVLEDSAPEVTNLSEYQSANSYVISHTGFYKFKADRRGNGVIGLNIVTPDKGQVYRTFDAGMGANITDVDHVDVLWWQGDLSDGSQFLDFANSNPTSEQIDKRCPVVVNDKGRLDNGEVMFMALSNASTYGNVGLAAYDANDEILWTWHLWIQPGVNVIRMGDYTLMDRNLGATYSPETNADFQPGKRFANLGFFYQWGRKDPFFGPSAIPSMGHTTMPYFYKNPGTKVWEKRTSYDVIQASTVPESVKQPLTYFKNKDGNGIWHTTYGASGDSPANDFWGYVGVAGQIGNAFAKTMYDPCPPGYKVMQHNVFMSANICNADNEVKFTLQTYLWTSPNGQYGVYFKDGDRSSGQTIRAGGIWFPNSGYINDSGDHRVANGGFGRVSTATPFSNGNILNNREIRWIRQSNVSNYYDISEDHFTKMAESRVVRCQME